ncbi:MAG: hypothetical protein IKQ85_03270 [Bacteroidaceae bacterium]|nr:hypothetical protein [Bacteroidaceae bacterium]
MKKLLTFAFALMSFGATAQNLSFEAMANEATVNISGATGMTALQFCLQLPAGVTIDTSNATMGEATSSHTLCIETLDNGDLLFILYSMNLNTFKDGEVLRIPININGEGTARLYNIRFADTDAVSYAGKETATGRKTLSNSPLKGENIYNLSGQQMVNGKSLNSKLPWGIYIKGGKKILAK